MPTVQELQAQAGTTPAETQRILEVISRGTSGFRSDLFSYRRAGTLDFSPAERSFLNLALNSTFIQDVQGRPSIPTAGTVGGINPAVPNALPQSSPTNITPPAAPNQTMQSVAEQSAILTQQFNAARQQNPALTPSQFFEQQPKVLSPVEYKQALASALQQGKQVYYERQPGTAMIISQPPKATEQKQYQPLNVFANFEQTSAGQRLAELRKPIEPLAEQVRADLIEKIQIDKDSIKNLYAKPKVVLYEKLPQLAQSEQPLKKFSAQLKESAPVQTINVIGDSAGRLVSYSQYFPKVAIGILDTALTGVGKIIQREANTSLFRQLGVQMRTEPEVKETIEFYKEPSVQFLSQSSLIAAAQLTPLNIPTNIYFGVQGLKQIVDVATASEISNSEDTAAKLFYGSLGVTAGLVGLRSLRSYAAEFQEIQPRFERNPAPSKFFPEAVSDKKVVQSIREALKTGRLPLYLKADLTPFAENIARLYARQAGLDFDSLSAVDREFLAGQIKAKARNQPAEFLPETRKQVLKSLEQANKRQELPEISKLALEQFEKTKVLQKSEPVEPVKQPKRIYTIKDFETPKIEEGIQSGKQQLVQKMQPPEQILKTELIKQELDLRGIQRALGGQGLTERQLQAAQQAELQRQGFGFGLLQSQVSASSIRQPQKQYVEFIEPAKEREALLFGEAQKSGQGFAQSEAQFLKSAQSQPLATAQAFGFAQSVGVAQAEAVASATQTKQLLKNEQIFLEPRFEKPFSSSRKRKRVYLKSVPVYSTFIKQKGIFRPISTNLSLGLALQVGATRTQRSLSRTFRIKETGFAEVSSFDIPFTPSKNVFRDYRIKNKRAVPLPFGVYIKKQSALLKTPEEKNLLRLARRKRIL